MDAAELGEAQGSSPTTAGQCDEHEVDSPLDAHTLTSPLQTNAGTLARPIGSPPPEQPLQHCCPPERRTTAAIASGAVIIAVSIQASGSTTPRIRAAKAKTNHSPNITRPDRKTRFA